MPYTSGWDLVTLGIALPRSYFCLCCLSFDGEGMHRHGVTYCLACWQKRQKSEPCSHQSGLPVQLRSQAS
ncbi:MAG TPA: hypothetical protein VF157_02785 [Chloroflexota bacterium]